MNIRWFCVVLIVAMGLAACVGIAGHATTQDADLKAMYERNRQLEQEIGRLEKELEQIEDQLTRTREDLANYRYVLEENEKFLAGLTR